MFPNFSKYWEKYYDGTCDIYAYTWNTDDKGRNKGQTKSLIYEAVPCRLDFSQNSRLSISSAEPNEPVQTAEVAATLYIGTDISVPTGAEVHITQYGKTYVLAHSGIERVYVSHREIALSVLNERCG